MTNDINNFGQKNQNSRGNKNSPSSGEKWYYSTPFLMGLSAGWIFIFPGILAIILYTNKKGYERRLSEEMIFEVGAGERRDEESKRSGMERNARALQARVRILQEKLIQAEGKAREAEREMIDAESRGRSLEQKKTFFSDLKLIRRKESAVKERESEVKKREKELLRLEENSQKERDKAEKKLRKIHSLLKSGEDKLRKLKSEIIEEEEMKLLQSFGFYKPKYGFENSYEYKEKLEDIRRIQKEMVKNKTAVLYYDEWLLDGSRAKGRAMNNDNIRMAVRAFNVEADLAISKVKFNTIDTAKKRIENSYRQLNRGNKRNRIEITNEYLNYKFEELYLKYEYELKKQEEREEQAAIRELMREEAKVKREIEREKLKIEKEERHFQNMLIKLEKSLKQFEEYSNQAMEIKDQISQIKEKLESLGRDKQTVFDRELNTRAGYVYIISNVGSFGEDIYKIGVTRRLEPEIRVNELGSASVPFKFDIHAMIFSEDAPGLENKLHKAFHDRRVNKINTRKEFFNVSLDEIENEVRTNHDKVVEFTKLANAQEYRETKMLLNSNQEMTEKSISA